MDSSIGVPDVLPVVVMFWSIFLVPVVAGIILLVLVFRGQRRIALENGYPSLSAYLRAAPRTDAEKRAAADLALKGAVICLLGLLFPPVLLVGLFPLFYGVRKVMYASMGLGLVDDARR
jgi:hypothetical protein